MNLKCMILRGHIILCEQNKINPQYENRLFLRQTLCGPTHPVPQTRQTCPWNPALRTRKCRGRSPQSWAPRERRGKLPWLYDRQNRRPSQLWREGSGEVWTWLVIWIGNNNIGVYLSGHPLHCVWLKCVRFSKKRWLDGRVNLNYHSDNSRTSNFCKYLTHLS